MIIYSSIGGTTRKVVQRVAEITKDTQLIDCGKAISIPPCNNISHIILICPTYGDEEFEDQFESFLIRNDWKTMSGVHFGFCELGVYTGYEEFGHGLASIVQQILFTHGLHELVPPLSIDTIPITDWHAIDAWAHLIDSRLMKQK